MRPSLLSLRPCDELQFLGHEHFFIYAVPATTLHTRRSDERKGRAFSLPTRLFWNRRRYFASPERAESNPIPSRKLGESTMTYTLTRLGSVVCEIIGRVFRFRLRYFCDKRYSSSLVVAGWSPKLASHFEFAGLHDTTCLDTLAVHNIVHVLLSLKLTRYHEVISTNIASDVHVRPRGSQWCEYIPSNVVVLRRSQLVVVPRMIRSLFFERVAETS